MTAWNDLLLLFFFFFSSRRRHTRCGRDWGSDVCSSDLYAAARARPAAHARRIVRAGFEPPALHARRAGAAVQRGLPRAARRDRHRGARGGDARDRKSVGGGKRVALGCRRIIKKKKRNRE